MSIEAMTARQFACQTLRIEMPISNLSIVYAIAKLSIALKTKAIAGSSVLDVKLNKYPFHSSFHIMAIYFTHKLN